jgi:endonuclease/exonuclease/phosphatase (EEP) superfamily protein YafD
MLLALRWLTVALGLFMAAGTLLSLSRSPHWFVRGWDFPRVQIAVLSALSGVTYAVLYSKGTPLDYGFLGICAATVVWQLYRIFPYTPIAPERVKRTRGTESREGRRFRLLITNVLKENQQFERLLRLVRSSKPDILLAVETDERWGRALEPLVDDYPHVVRQLQDNYYGMILFSRLPLLESRVDFLVQEDIPSVHATFELDGERVVLHGLHPRPPEPLRNQDSTPRDAELVVVGKAIAKDPDQPTVVAGDLNDVAWSPTSQLFLRLSGLLDPRMGRGFYNSYDANNPLFRFPLDHVFHSNHFRLVELRRCEKIGSDHYPMLIELSYEPDAPAEQPETRTEQGDQEEGREKLEAQADAARTGADRPGNE